MNSLIKSKRSQSAFTLVELMVVIVVIGIVGGIIFSGAGYLFEKQAIKQATVEVEVLRVALDEFKREYGDFPETFDNEGEMASFILFHSLYGTHQLSTDTEAWERVEISESRKNLLPVDKMTLETLSDDESEKFNFSEFDHYLVDPWGEPYIYQFPRQDEQRGFLLYSKGPDQKGDPFNESLDSLPQKRLEDRDNIPSTEPGNW
ncbi:type II secretion system protein GspG [Opitutales bacterium]|nr:type II secretion system protein GspG [Opitutales bacterium]